MQVDQLVLGNEVKQNSLPEEGTTPTKPTWRQRRPLCRSCAVCWRIMVAGVIHPHGPVISTRCLGSGGRQCHNRSPRSPLNPLGTSPTSTLVSPSSPLLPVRTRGAISILKRITWAAQAQAASKPANIWRMWWPRRFCSHCLPICCLRILKRGGWHRSLCLGSEPFA